MLVVALSNGSDYLPSDFGVKFGLSFLLSGKNGPYARESQKCSAEEDQDTDPLDEGVGVLHFAAKNEKKDGKDDAAID